MMTRTRLLAAASLSALAAPAFADADAQTRSDGPDEVIVVTSTALALGSDDVAGSVTVLGQNELRRTFNNNIGDTLDSLPGLSSSFYGPAAGRPVVRGLDADRVRLLINGLDVLDASREGADHAVAAELFGAEGIEVLRGPAAIAYGGGAIGGVINILDGRIATEAMDAPYDGYVYLGATSVDEGTQVGARGRAAAGPLVLQLDYERREAGDYSISGFAQTQAERAGLPDDEIIEGELINSGYIFETVSGGASLVGEWGYTGLSVKRMEADYGLPGEEENLVVGQTRYDLRGEVRLDGFFERVRFAGAYSDYAHTEFDEGEPETEFTLNGFEGRAELTRRGDDIRRGAVGVQVLSQDFAAIGDEAFVEPVSTEDWGLFAVERWDYGGWGFEAGARAETRSLEGVRASRSFSTWAGSGTVFLRPDESWFVSVNLSRSERAPTDLEVFADGVHVATNTYELGDLDLGTESAWSGEVSARWRSGGVRAEATAFYAKYDGFIALTATGEEREGFPLFEYRQQDADLYGFEASIEAPLGRAAGFDLIAEASADYVRAEIDAGGSLPRIPPMSATLALNAERGIWSLRGEGRFVAEQTRTGAEERPTDGYTLVNASAEVAPFADRDIRIIAGVRNIFDEEARSHASFVKERVPLPGRNVRLAVSTRF
jgi:iron complex outermembrane recepter protein